MATEHMQAVGPTAELLEPADGRLTDLLVCV
jgi:hypothetical protein